MHERLLELQRSPEEAGIFLDFDGTLSEIVLVPSDARPHEGVPALLESLSQKYRVVSIISGRSARQLVEWLGPDIEIWGVHGAERATNGEVRLAGHAQPFAELMQRVRDEAETAIAGMDLPGVVIEDKTVMIGLHFRAATDVDTAREKLDTLAEELATRHGLLRAGGRLAFELRPPRDFSKAAVVLERAREEHLKSAMFVGDDRVDLPGFDALDALAEEGISTLRVGVDSSEAPPELLERADVVVDGPTGVVALLRQLL